MEKIPTLFKRDFEGNRQVVNEVTPGAEWVTRGEGIPTEKLDGTSCLVKDGVLYKRYDAKNGKQPPVGFIPAQPVSDPVTGHWPGWLAVGEGPEDKYHREAFANAGPLSDGTYELLGPKIQGNPYGDRVHWLQPHGAIILGAVPTDFTGLYKYLKLLKIEGVVWHHPDGRMVKIKRRDFGIEWPLKKEDES